MNITDLPIELYQLILDFLSVPDLLALRLANKFFFEVVKEFRVKELCFQKGYAYLPKNYGQRGQYTFKSHTAINYLDGDRPMNLISSKNLHLLKKPFFNIKRLKKLEICLNPQNQSCGIGDAHINFLIHLEELRIVLRNLWDLEDFTWRLVLPKLKVFELVKSSFLNCGRINVDAPLLHSLKMMRFEKESAVNLDHPSSVKSLHSLWIYPKLGPFENLEEWTIYLYDNHIDFKTLERKNQLDFIFGSDFRANGEFSAFKKLRTLRVMGGFASALDLNQFYTLVRNQLISKGNHFQFIFNGLRLTGGQEFGDLDLRKLRLRIGNDLHTEKQNQLNESIMQNFEKTEDNLRFITSIEIGQNFGSWFEKENEPSIPIDLLLSRFTSLRKIEVTSEIECPNRFAQFVAGCKNLGELHLEDSQLPQQFFDQLPSISSLYDLEIDDLPDREPLNFRFVSRMFGLRRLCSGHHLITAIQNEDFDLSRFAEIEFATNEREFFFGYLYRNETASKTFQIQAYRPFGVERQGYQHPAFLHTGDFELLEDHVYDQMDNKTFMQFYSEFQIMKYIENPVYHPKCTIL